MKLYAPRAAPSETAAISVAFLAGSEKVTEGFPCNSRAALPAARLNVSWEYVADFEPRPVKTINLTIDPGIFITSSAFPVAPMSAN